MSTHLAYVGDCHGVLSACRDLIFAARESVIVQMYLFTHNGDQTLLLPRDGAFPYAETVAGWLVERKRALPNLSIAVVLDSNTPADPSRTRRRGELVRAKLERAGIAVLHANLFHTRLDPRRRRVPAMNFHLDHAHVPAHAWVEKQNRWQALHNVEDHRKNLVIDGGRAAVVTSHNFFDPAWDWHENLIWLTGDGARTVWRIAQDSVRDALEIPQLLTPAQRAMCTALVDAETTRDTTQLEPALQPVPNFHAGDLSRVQRGLEPDPQCRIVQSEEIRARMEHLLESSSRGDDVVLATTYFSDDPLLDALDRAAARGVRVRVLIDSLHALPLPPLAAWLTRNLVNHHAVTRGAALHTRWGDRFQLRIHNSSAGAMMHLKTLARLGPNGCAVLGQANCTPNSFSGAWLETDIETRAPGVIRAIGDHFDQLWSLPESRPAVPTHTLTARAQSALHSSLLRAFSWFGLRP